MEIKNEQVLAARIALAELAQIPLPVASAFKVARLHRKMQELSEDLEKVRQRLLETRVEKDAKGNLRSDEATGEAVFLSPEHKADFVVEYTKLLQLSSEVSVEPLTLADFGDAKVAPSTLINLGPLLADA